MVSPSTSAARRRSIQAIQRETWMVIIAIGSPISVMARPRASDQPVTTTVNVRIPIGSASSR